MPEQSKFENMDLFASLEAIMKQNTGFYQSDLDIDKEIIAKAAASPHREDKTLLWFCRPSGTHCFRERDVFLKDTAPHNTWRFYIPHTMGCLLIDCTTRVAIFSVVTAVFFACLPAFCASRAALAYWRFSFFLYHSFASVFFFSSG